MRPKDLIRESIQQNLSGLHVSPQRQTDMIDKIVGGKRMKRKMPFSIVLAAILALMSITALAAGTNLFSYFSNRDIRYGEVAEQAAHIAASPAQMESEALGKVSARIDSVYYDGQSLSVGCIIDNAVRIEAYTPSESELANAQTVIDPMEFPAGNPEEQQVLDAFRAAIEKGEPYGYAIYQIYPGGQTLANDIELPPCTGVEEYDDTGAYRVIRDYEAPLPEEVQNQDSLRLKIQLYESVNFHYFDGENIRCYQLASRDAGSITATVPRTQAETRAYAGTAAIEGVTFKARASLSAMQGKITLEADRDIFTLVTFQDGDESWQDLPWQLAVFDENGAEYRNMDGYSLTQLNPMEISIEGSGQLPKELHLYLLHADSPDVYDYWPEADKGLANDHLVLTPCE